MRTGCPATPDTTAACYYNLELPLIQHLSILVSQSLADIWYGLKMPFIITQNALRNTKVHRSQQGNVSCRGVLTKDGCSGLCFGRSHEEEGVEESGATKSSSLMDRYGDIARRCGEWGEKLRGINEEARWRRQIPEIAALSPQQ